MRSKEQGPVTQQFSLVDFTDGLISDLQALRKGKISPHDAHARAALARQVLRSVHYIITAQKYIEGQAIPIGSLEHQPSKDRKTA